MQRTVTAPVKMRDNALVARVARHLWLPPAETAALMDLSETARTLPAQSEIAAEDRSTPPQVVLSGWACHQRLLADGRRQIVRFLLPGDVIGSLLLPDMPAACSAMSLTPVLIADAQPLAAAIAAPGGSPVLEAMAVALLEEDGLILRDQIVRLGRQTAYERLLHLILETHHRLCEAGQADGDTFAMPLTQEILADALGLSVVHLNRTLQQARREGLFNFRGGQVSLLQPGIMRAMADWSPPTGLNAAARTRSA